MNEVTLGITNSVGGIYSSLVGLLPDWAQGYAALFLWSLLLVLYSIFIWKFYRWIARKDILKLNLSRFNHSEHAVISKLIGAGIYFVEYLILLPIVVVLWFGVFTLFLMLLTEALDLKTILIISVTIVAAIRMTSYYKEDLARELSKLIPFTLLTVAISQGLFNFDKVVEQIQMFPNFFSDIWSYIIFIVALEFFLRILDTIFVAFDIYDEAEIKCEDTIKEEKGD